MEMAHSTRDVTGDEAQIRGDRDIQRDVLVALAECRNHRKWFAGFAKPYLGDSPIEIGSGLGDYAREWIPLVSSFTATDADPATVLELKQAMSGYPQVSVSQVMLPTEDRAGHSCLIAYNVLEHIEDDIGALASMGRLVRPGGHVVLVCPAFPFAMSPVDIVDVRYANSLGLVCYYVFTSLLRRTPAEGGTMTFYDRLVVPLVQGLEKLVGRPPFGQSVLAIAKVKDRA
jgi:SAM-dependent methyltransferase